MIGQLGNVHVCSGFCGCQYNIQVDVFLHCACVTVTVYMYEYLGDCIKIFVRYKKCIVLIDRELIEPVISKISISLNYPFVKR